MKKLFFDEFSEDGDDNHGFITQCASMMLAVVVFALCGCSTVIVNVGDKAIEAANGCTTNAVVSESFTGTNSTSVVNGSASILITVNMNAAKDISPNTTIPLTE